MTKQKSYYTKFQIQNTVKLFGFLFFIMLGYFAVEAQTLKGDFRFQGNLNSTGVTSPPSMVSLGTGDYQTETVDGYTRTTRSFPQNNGLSVNTSGDIPNNNYTIVMLFKLNTVTGRRRIFDPKQGTSNVCGLYVEGGRFVGEDPPQPSPPMYADTFVQVVISRQSNGSVQIYRDGYVAMAFNDFSAGCYILNNDNPRFFRDDGTEASSGNVARIRFYNQPMNSIQVRNLDRPHLATGSGDQSILFTSFRNGKPDIYSMNADGSNHRRLTTGSFLATQARWSPDKSKIVFTNRITNVNEIYTMNANGINPVRLTTSPSTILNQNASWKPDGSKIIYSRCNLSVGLCDLYTMDPNGTNQQPFPLVTGVDDRDFASYSPDGSKIVFTEFQSATNRVRIYTINSDASGNLTPLTNVLFPAYDFNARWSPDGTKITFTRDADFNTPRSAEVFVMDSADGGNLTQLTNDGSSFDPVWSPTGSRIAFSSIRDNEIEIYTMNSTDGSGVNRYTFDSVGDTISDWFRVVRDGVLFDFDGDGKSDLSVFRPSNQTWYINPSSNMPDYTFRFGFATDKIVPADFDGDDKTDIAVWREEPSDPTRAIYYIVRSSDNTFYIEQFGKDSDQPFIVGDWDGDDIDDVAVYREGENNTNNIHSYFFYRPSSNTSRDFETIQWGFDGDIPVRGDFNGDGKLDAAVFRPGNGFWYINFTGGGGFIYQQFGLVGDKLVPADYDGDGITDIAVFRDGTWYILQSSNGQVRYVTFGLATDKLVPADYDGDGKTDVAVYRDGIWYILSSMDGNVIYGNFGTSDDFPIPNAYVSQ